LRSKQIKTKKHYFKVPKLKTA